MNLEEYKDKASDTAIYPHRGSYDGLDYCVMGLCGEIGECFNILKKCVRDDDWKLTEEKIKKFINEGGGVSWYISQILYELHVKVGSLEKDMDKFQEELFSGFQNTQESKYKNKIKRLKHILSSAYLRSAAILNIMNNLESVELGDKKSNETEIYSNLEEIGKHIIVILNSMIIFFSECDVKITKVFDNNIELLYARKKAGTIKGSGDGIENR